MLCLILKSKKHKQPPPYKKRSKCSVLHSETLDCRNMVLNNEVSGTLQAKTNGGHSLNYINPVVVYDSKDKSI